MRVFDDDEFYGVDYKDVDDILASDLSFFLFTK